MCMCFRKDRTVTPHAIPPGGHIKRFSCVRVCIVNKTHPPSGGHHHEFPPSPSQQTDGYTDGRG